MAFTLRLVLHLSHYKDLMNERISIGRAILELQALNKHQKGG